MTTGAWYTRTAADLFREWADGAVRKLPLYRRICDAAASDDEVAARLALSPDPNQRVPNLLLAAVHDVVLAGDPAPAVTALAEWYPSVTDEPRPVGPGDDDPWPLFREVALVHEGVAQRLMTRATQTNEVGRCAALLPALAELAADGSSLGLVEVGASAGLNLLVDRYGYRYERPTGELIEVGTRSPLVLRCSLRGELVPPVPAVPPTVAHRCGIDRSPVDLTDPGQARWLLACQWPDERERFRRARLAIEVAQVSPPPVREGDAVDDVAHALLAVPEGSLPVAVSTWVMSYFTAERQQELVSILDAVGAQRDVSLVYQEQPSVVGGFSAAGALPPRPDGGPDGSATALVRIDWRGGERRARRLADHHPHGTWLEWLAS